MISMLCKRVGMSRQNYYAKRKLRRRRKIEEDIVLALTRRERAMQPRLGKRKTLKLISGEPEAAGTLLGKNCYFDVLRDNEILIRPKLR